MGFSQPTEDTLAHSWSSSSQSPHLRPEKSPSAERERTIPNWEMLPNGILQIGPNLMRNIKWGELWNNPLERIGFISGGNSAALRVQHIVRIYTDQLNFPYLVYAYQYSVPDSVRLPETWKAFYRKTPILPSTSRYGQVENLSRSSVFRSLNLHFSSFLISKSSTDGLFVPFIEIWMLFR